MKNIRVIFLLAVVGIAIQLGSCRTSQTATTEQTTASSDESLGLMKPIRTPTKAIVCACQCMQNNVTLFKDNACVVTSFNFNAKTVSATHNCLTKMNGQACSGYSQIKSILANPKGVVAPPECKGPIDGILANCVMSEVLVWPGQPVFPNVPAVL